MDEGRPVTCRGTQYVVVVWAGSLHEWPKLPHEYWHANGLKWSPQLLTHHLTRATPLKEQIDKG